MSIYIDSELVNSVPFSGPIIKATSDLIFGARSHGGPHAFFS